MKISVHEICFSTLVKIYIVDSIKKTCAIVNLQTISVTKKQHKIFFVSAELNK